MCLIVCCGAWVKADFTSVCRSLYTSYDATSRELRVVTPTGLQRETITLPSTIRMDGVSYDITDGSFWTTFVASGESGFIYNFDRKGVLLETIEVYLTGGAEEIEAVCVDGIDGTLWVLDDAGNTATIRNAQRLNDGTAAPDVDWIAAAININASAGIDSAQDICYDSISGSFWVTQNVGASAPFNNKVFNISRTGVLISSFVVSDILGGTPGLLQGLSHDPDTDTLWISARTGEVYNITKTGMLISKFDSEFVDVGADPLTGVAIAPYFPLTIYDPVAKWEMEDDAADKVVLDLTGQHKGVSENNTDTFGDGTFFEFNGSTDWVIFPGLALAGDYTMSVWCRPDDVTGNTFIGGVDNTNYIRISTANSITLSAGGALDTGVFTNGSFPTDGTWFNLIVIRKATTTRVYKDKLLLDDTIDANNTLTVTTIGVRDSGTTPDKIWNGGMRDLIILPYAATEAQRELLFDVETVESLPEVGVSGTSIYGPKINILGAN